MKIKNILSAALVVAAAVALFAVMSPFAQVAPGDDCEIDSAAYQSLGAGVTDIIDVPDTIIFVGNPSTLTLTGTVLPVADTIIWSIALADDGTTGASIAGDTLSIMSVGSGTVTVTATVTDGVSSGVDYTKDFAITVFVPVTDITGVPGTVILGTPLTLTGTVDPSDATNQTIVWSVSSADDGTTGASVDPSGVLRVTAAGSRTVTVTATITDGSAPSSNYNQDFNLTVFVPVTNITGVPTTVVLGTGLTLSGTVDPSNADNQTIVWSVSPFDAGTTGANVSSGVLSVSSAGTVTVRATITNGSSPSSDYTQDFNLSVFVPVTSISGVPGTVILGTPLTLTSTVNPTDATNQTIVWSVVSANGTGATITPPNTLSITSAGTGTVTIRATISNGLAPSSNYTQDFTLIVFVPVTNIFGPDTVVFGTSLTLIGVVAPTNATNRTIVWSISPADDGTTGASISFGTLSITSAGSGTVTVRATITNGSSPSSDYILDFPLTVFVPVTDITDVPTLVILGTDLTLTGTVVPGNADNQTIVWSVLSANGTGAIINAGVLSVTAAGTVTVRATITNGETHISDYIQDFVLTVFVPVTGIPDVPTTMTVKKAITLPSAVAPANADNQTIVWCIKDDGGTEATLDGNVLNTKKAGIVVVTATVTNGLGPGMDFVQDFEIEITKDEQTARTSLVLVAVALVALIACLYLVFIRKY